MIALATLITGACIFGAAFLGIGYADRRRARRDALAALTTPPEALPAVTRHYYEIASDASALLRDLLRDEDTTLTVFIRESDRDRALDVTARFYERNTT